MFGVCFFLFILTTEFFLCVDNDDIPFILISNRISIRKVTLRGKRGRARYAEIIRSLRNTIGVDFDWKGKRLYWTDVMTDKIQRAKFDGREIETVVSGGLLSAEGPYRKIAK